MTLKLFHRPILARTLSSRIYAKVFLILNWLGIAQRIAFSVPFSVGERQFKIPIVLSVGEGNVTMGDTWLFEIFSKLLPKRTGAVLDVGANVGQTLLKIKSCSSERAWIGFEPNPTCVMYLERLIAENRFLSCTLIPAGLHSEIGVKELAIYDTDSADKAASLVKNFRPDQVIFGRKWVPCFDFSTLSRAGINLPISIVKIDVEGGEKEALESLQAVLEKFRPFVVLEILPAYSADNRMRLERQRAVEKQFRELNYTICRIEKIWMTDVSD